MTAFKKVIATSFAVGMLLPALAFAQTTTSTGVQALLDQIKALQAQMASLVQQQQSLAQQQQALAGQQQTAMVSLIRTLRQGATGDDVRALQALLAADPSIYPEGTISGFYGRLTAQAVKRFQKMHGLAQVGDVGPRTLERLNQFLQQHPMGWDTGSSTSATSTGNHFGHRGEGDDHRPCAIVPPGHLIAPGWLRKHDGEDKPIIPECQKLPRGIEDKGDSDWQRSTSTVASKAPVISGVSATNVTTTGATIVWVTNKNSSSQVEYGTTNSYGSMTSLDSTLVLNHSVGLVGLSPSTLYHYRVYSVDGANRTSTSSDMTFTTAAVPDTTAPSISGISASPIATTTATVSWTTNEIATGKVYYSSTTPVDTTTALSMSSASLSLSHSFDLTGLTAATTYYFTLVSADAVGNTATTTGSSFTTTN